MSIFELVNKYQEALLPIFGAEFHITYEGEDCISIILDGEKQDFCFTLYGIMKLLII